MSLLDEAKKDPKRIAAAHGMRHRWIAFLPPDVQEEIVELRRAVMADELPWSVSGTYRFVKEELSKKGVDLGVCETTWKQWWRYDKEKEAG